MTCASCGADLAAHVHSYELSVIIGARNRDSVGVTGLGTHVIHLCPECIRSFLEQYGLQFPDLMAALHVVNDEERNPV